ncbi:chromosome partitioning protein [Nocardioides sp. dk4132]|uniref:AAA family ATPase n=1 Tax=unclassified Nocardioides TaxID=2615069 RepID=UPI00129582E9|nr:MULTISPECIES: chromosome partitioning protein [unclassified Nocardioides]MQW75731.1 chromosome partitioning protein [Nocardioides sp. dk4132]QGA08617.1 chromosome partitioning protein [Nocardioides sp. dk884]
MSVRAPVVVLVVAAGAAWESRAMTLLGETTGVVVLKRCVDVDDLLAVASAGQADVAVVGLDAPGLDGPAIEHLRAHGVRAVAVAARTTPADAARLHAVRLGIASVLGEDGLEDLPGAVLAAREQPPTQPAAEDLPDDRGDAAAGSAPGRPGRIVAVWGPAGAPGRSTVAVGLAAELARRGLRTVLVDADPQAASISQQLGILDEVSGLLAAARLAAAGQLADRFATVQRSIGADLSVITGLPRPDRWTEVRPGALEVLLDVARAAGQVVVDTGASLESDPLADVGPRPARHQLTLAALESADEVVVVGAPDPVGLARLARALVELRENGVTAPLRVVLNRMRPTLGWSEREVASMVAGFVPLAGLHFLPEDRAATDRALLTGRTFLDGGDSALTRGVGALADALLGAPARSVRTRRAGRARRR